MAGGLAGPCQAAALDSNQAITKVAGSEVASMSPKTATGCCYCRGLLVGRSNAPYDQLVGETDRYVLAPTKGALVPGWLLVVAKVHQLCSGALGLEEFSDLELAIEDAVRRVESRFGPATLFEHGPARTGHATGCGIDHHHVHVAHLPFSLSAAVQNFAPELKWVDAADLRVSRAAFHSGCDYLLFRERGGTTRLSTSRISRSQFFRRAIAAQLGIPNQFDYRTHPHLSNVAATLAALTNGTERATGS